MKKRYILLALTLVLLLTAGAALAECTGGKKHDAEVAIPSVAATCTETGLTAKIICSVCGDTLQEQTIVAAKGHKEVIDAGIAPTCTATGFSAGAHCSVCGTVTKARQMLPANGHSPEVTDEAVAPTCLKAGSTRRVWCTVCRAELEAKSRVAPTGHVYALWSPLGDGTHTAACTNDGCAHEEVVACQPLKVTLEETEYAFCPICGEFPGTEHPVLPRLLSMRTEALRRGMVLVRSMAAPMDGVMHVMTVAGSYAGLIEPLKEPVEVAVPFEEENAFVLMLVTEEGLTEVPFTLEEGVLTFTVDKEGLYLALSAE